MRRQLDQGLSIGTSPPAARTLRGRGPSNRLLAPVLTGHPALMTQHPRIWSMSETGEVEIGDGVVVLCPLRIEDAAVHLAGEDFELVRWLNGGPGTTESVRHHIEHVQHMWENHGPIFTFAIRLAAKNTLIGTIDVQLEQDANQPDQAHLAYGLYPDWRGRGFATRAVSLALEFLRQSSSVRSAVIRVEPENLLSAGVAIRAGFALSRPAAENGDGLDWYEHTLR
jgi:RimJ/RimL family protein N-acetyltransferase